MAYDNGAPVVQDWSWQAMPIDGASQGGLRAALLPSGAFASVPGIRRSRRLGGGTVTRTVASDAVDNPPGAPPGAGAPAIAIDIALNVVLPYAAYLLLKHAGQTDARALILSAAVPAAVALASLVRRRRINGLSLLVIFATAMSLGATALSGSAWFALIRPSFVTGSIALAFLASLALKRPALFYLARDTTCPTPGEARAFEARWASATFRRSMRRLTVVWAVFLGGEALLRAGLAAIWPNATVVAVSQVLWIVLPILLTRWSIRAGERWAAAARQSEG